MSSENNGAVTENVVGEFAEVVDMPAQAEETTEKALVELKASSLQHFPEETQQAIIALADSIDVTQIEKIMSYLESTRQAKSLLMLLKNVVIY